MGNKRHWNAFKDGWTNIKAGFCRLAPKQLLRQKQTGYHRSYVVRFWRTTATVPWRAALIDPYSGRIHYFADRAALYAFLDTQIDGSADDGV